MRGMVRQLFLMIFICSSLLTFMLGCSSSSTKEGNSVEAGFKMAEELDKDERWEEALQKYQEVKALCV